MSRFTATRIFSSAIGFAAMLTAGTAAADYRVTAFGDTTAFSALISMDVKSAEARFATIELAALDFKEANNLCVTEILVKDLPAAVAACETALDKIKREPYLSATTAKFAKASIYSNMAVAKAMGGDLNGASKDLETALFFNSRDDNALNNFDLISQSAIAMDVAQSL